MRFLPPGWLTPVLPPTEESTWASKVVGTWTYDNPALIAGRCKSSHVTDDTATQSDHSAIAPEAVRDEHVENSADGRQRLMRLAIRQNGFDDAAAAAAPRPANPCKEVRQSYC